jgi:hypothetical protein
MPVTLTQIVDHVAAMEPETDRRKISATVRETIMAVGLLVDSRSGEIYSPAPPPSNVPTQRNVRWSGGRRRR